LKVLVTGANGQVGSEIVQQGEKIGLQMLATGRDELDITQRNAVDSFIRVSKPDIVINAAAYTAVDKAESEPELAYAINYDGVTFLAQACADNNIPLLHISTDYVFDGSKQGAYSETDSANPQTIYGKSKLEGDRAIEAILEQYIILRVSWVFGSVGNNFVKTMLRLAKDRDELQIVEDQHGGPTWAGAIASILLSLVKRIDDGEAIPWGTFHYSGQPATTWWAFAGAIFETAEGLGVIGKQPMIEPILTKDYPTPAQRPLNSVLNCDKILTELGVPQSDWETGLDCMLLTCRE
jgi:dTDP-4-dehydrorhamnose reductase